MKHFISKIICKLFGHKTMVIKATYMNRTIKKTVKAVKKPKLIVTSKKLLNYKLVMCPRCGEWKIEKS